jgi:ribonuclease P protein component
LRPDEFERVFAEGERVYGRGFQVVARPAGGDRSRLGLAIAKRVGHAPRRARVRRLARAAFRAQRTTWPVPIELVIVVRDDSGPLASGPPGTGRPPRLREVHRALAKALRRLPWRRWQAVPTPANSPLPTPPDAS